MVKTIKTLVFLSVLLFPRLGYAGSVMQLPDATKPWTYKVMIGTSGFGAYHNIPDTFWIVAKGTETFTLTEFISSGKFCEARHRHDWVEENHYGTSCAYNEVGDGGLISIHRGMYCTTCGRCRRKIKTTRQVEEWEP